MAEDPLPPPDEEFPLPPQEPEPPQEPAPPQEPEPLTEPEPPQEPEPLTEPEPPLEPGPPREEGATTDHYSEVKLRKSGPLATLRRAGTIFQKDLGTMAKHGLISSIIVAVFLGIVFSIASYSMSIALTMDFGDGGDGDEINLPGGTETVPPIPVPGPDRTVEAGTLVTMDGSASTDNAEIVYYSWYFYENSVDVDLYGEVVAYRFMAAGTYTVTLSVVDSSWNMAEANFALTVESSGGDSERPMAYAGDDMSVDAGTTVILNGSGSTDNVGIVNWTWSFDDVVHWTLYGETIDYTFMNSYDESGRSVWGNLIVRDEAGNIGMDDFNINVNPVGDDWNTPHIDFSTDDVVVIGDSVSLDASGTYDQEGMIADYTWYLKHNATKWTLSGEVTSFQANEWGPYEVILAVRDTAGNVASTNRTVIALPEGFDVDQVSWVATPFGQDVSFNLLTYAYGMSLLASVIYIAGLFGKGFSHEVQKTTVIFSKLLYPIVLGPVFIYPLVVIGMMPFHQSLADILVITTVSYLLAVLVLVSAAFGSCLIYAAAKRMVVKPTVITRVFMYLSLVGTMTVFEWLSFLMDMQFQTEQWGDMYLQYGEPVALLSPFHQGGVLLSDMILSSGASPDWWVFAIPAALIVGGVLASRRLYPDLFSRE